LTTLFTKRRCALSGGAAATERARSAKAVRPIESETVTRTTGDSTAVGVPPMVSPVIVRPAGKLLATQLYGGVPPVAARVAE